MRKILMFFILIAAVNSPSAFAVPEVIFSGCPSEIYTGSQYRCTIRVEDPDGSPVNFKLRKIAREAKNVVMGKTAGTSSSQIFALSFQAGPMPGTYEFDFVVRGISAMNIEELNIEVLQAPAPVFTEVTNKMLPAGKTTRFDVEAVKENGEPADSIIAAQKPPGSLFDGRTFSWKTNSGQIGVHEVVFKAIDRRYQAESEMKVKIKVTPPLPSGPKIPNAPKRPRDNGDESITL